MKNFYSRCFLTVLLLSTLCMYASAQTVVWDGSKSTAWNEKQNWSTNSVPSSSNDVVIGSAGFASAPTITGSVTVKSLTIGGAYAATLTVNAALTINGNMTINGNGTLTQAANTTITAIGNWASSGNYNGPSTAKVIFAGAVQEISGTKANFKNLVVNKGSTALLKANVTGVNSISIFGTWNPNEAPSYVLSGSTSFRIEATGTAKVMAQTAPQNYQFTGGPTLIPGCTVDYAATTIPVQEIYSNFDYDNLRISGTGTKKLTGDYATWYANASADFGNVTVASGILDINTFTLSRGNTGGKLTVDDGAKLRIGGTSSLPVFSAYSFGATSTVEYYGTTQTVTAGTYGNLMISSTGTKTAANVLNVLNDFTLSAATFIAGSYTHTIGGDWKMTSGVLTNTTATKILLNGSGAQTIASTDDFNILEIDKSGGTTTILTDITTTKNLNLKKGVIATGAYKVIVPNGGTLTGASQSNGWVAGNLQKHVTGASTFEIGNALYYSPLSLTFGTLTAGSLVVGVVDASHPNIATSNINKKNISIYWNISKPAGSSIAYTNAVASLKWNSAENYTPMVSAAEIVASYIGSTWSYPTVTAPANTSISAAIGSTFPSLAVGETCPLVPNFSYTGTPYTTLDGNADVTFNNGGSAGAFTFTPAGLKIDDKTGRITLSESTINTYTVTNTVGTGACITSSNASITIVAVVTGIWKGTKNSDWFEKENWSDKKIPVDTSSVTIPSTSVKPVITKNNAEVKNLVIQSGATITNEGALQIAGTITNSGSIVSTSGTIVMNGTSLQTIPTGLFGSTNTIDHLVISNAAGVKLAGSLRITNVLGFGNVNNSTFNTVGFLTLVSTATKTAQVGDVTNDGKNLGNKITGEVTVERYSTARRSYRFLTAPVNSTTSIKANWMENTNNPNTYTNNDPNPGYGTHITGKGGNDNGFDVTVTNNASMFTFDNMSQTWTSIPNTSGLLKAGTPYRIMIRGNRSTNLSSNEAASSFTTLRSKGILTTGQVVLAQPGVGTSGMPVLNPTLNAYSLVANPYAAVVDWKQVVKKDIASTIYYYDPTISGTNGRGAYITYNDFTGGISNPTSKVDNNIQSGQAFFVQTTGAAPSVTFEEKYKTVSQKSVFREPKQLPHLSVKLVLPRDADTGGAADGFAAYFSEDFDSTIADDDSYKMTNLDENIGILRNGKTLSIEGRKPVTKADTLPMRIWQLTQSRYLLKIDVANFAENVTAYLEDAYLKSNTVLNNNTQTTLTFSIDSNAASIASDRFRIVFESFVTLPVKLTGVKAVEKNKDVLVEWTAESESNIESYQVERSNDAYHFTSAASVQAKGNTGIAVDYNWVDVSPFNGDNYYRIKSIDKSGEIKYSEIVKVHISTANRSTSITASEVSGNSIAIVMKNMEKGNYAVRLMNNSGQTVYSGNVVHSGGTATKVIAVDNDLASGIYQMQVIHNNAVQNVTLLVR